MIHTSTPKKIRVMFTPFRDGLQSSFGGKVRLKDILPAMEFAAKEAKIRHFEFGGRKRRRHGKKKEEREKGQEAAKRSSSRAREGGVAPRLTGKPGGSVLPPAPGSTEEHFDFRYFSRVAAFGGFELPGQEFTAFSRFFHFP